MSTASEATWPYESKGSDSAVTVRFSESTGTPRFAVGYWSIRGLAAPLRMMLCAAKQDHTVYMYDIVECPESVWTSGYPAEKAIIKKQYNPLINLPYAVDNEAKIMLAQTNACLQYIGECVGMMGSSPVERGLCAQFLCEIYDLRCVMTNWCYGRNADEAAATVAGAGKHLSKLDNYLSSKSTKHFLVGESLTAPDFHLFEILDQFELLCQCRGLPALLEGFPALGAFKSGFAQLPYVTENGLRMHEETSCLSFLLHSHVTNCFSFSLHNSSARTNFT